MNRDLGAERPNALWLADFTYVATWAGFVHVAFFVGAFAMRIVLRPTVRRECAGRAAASRWRKSASSPLE